jgi:hypothetical protein
MDRPPSTLVHVPGPLLAALHVCHPGGLPAWFHRATPRNRTAGRAAAG